VDGKRKHLVDVGITWAWAAVWVALVRVFHWGFAVFALGALALMALDGWVVTRLGIRSQRDRSSESG
jgi:hypothetical protein